MREYKFVVIAETEKEAIKILQQGIYCKVEKGRYVR